LQNHLSFPNASIGNMVFQAVRTRFPLRIVAGMTEWGVLQLAWRFGWIISGRSTPPVSESGSCAGSGVFFLTQERVVSLADFAPLPFRAHGRHLWLRRRRRERDPRATITQNIVYHYVLMIGRRWPAPAVVRSGLAGPLVGMEIAGIVQ